MAEVNVIPLIDILLVLIIIFMVITPTTPKGLPALIPQPNDRQETGGPNVLVVQLFSDGSLKINEEKQTWEGLGPRIEEIFKLRSERAAFVSAEAGVEFSQVARAIDILRSSNVEHVGLLSGRERKATPASNPRGA